MFDLVRNQICEKYKQDVIKKHHSLYLSLFDVVCSVSSVEDKLLLKSVRHWINNVQGNIYVSLHSGTFPLYKAEWHITNGPWMKSFVLIKCGRNENWVYYPIYYFIFFHWLSRWKRIQLHQTILSRRCTSLKS